MAKKDRRTIDVSKLDDKQKKALRDVGLLGDDDNDGGTPEVIIARGKSALDAIERFMGGGKPGGKKKKGSDDDDDDDEDSDDEDSDEGPPAVHPYFR